MFRDILRFVVVVSSSHNDVPQVAQLNESIVAHSRHRSPSFTEISSLILLFKVQQGLYFFLLYLLIYFPFIYLFVCVVCQINADAKAGCNNYFP